MFCPFDLPVSDQIVRFESSSFQIFSMLNIEFLHPDRIPNTSLSYFDFFGDGWTGDLVLLEYWMDLAAIHCPEQSSDGVPYRMFAASPAIEITKDHVEAEVISFHSI